jgi:hypothetical protein
MPNLSRLSTPLPVVTCGDQKLAPQFVGVLHDKGGRSRPREVYPQMPLNGSLR